MDPSNQALPFSEAAIKAADRAFEQPHGGRSDLEITRDALTAAVNADPRSKAFLELARLSDEELVERVAAALAAHDGYDLDRVPERPAHGNDERWAQSDYRRQAAAVLAALGLPVDEQEVT